MRILVTGAARAIGATTCRLLSDEGHEVVATARDPKLLEGLGAAQCLRLDVTDDASVAEALEAAGELDAIVNNAALPGKAPLESVPLDHLAAMFETNAIGALRVVQQIAPAWRERGRGVIVNVSSIQGRVASPLEGAYAATKFALEAISEALHFELGHFGIRTVLIEPGYTAPGMKQIDPFEHPSAYDELYAQWEGTDAKVNSTGRTPPEVVARAIADAIADPSTPLRVPVGEDAALILGSRSQMDDAAFEAAMRAVLGLTW